MNRSLRSRRRPRWRRRPWLPRANDCDDAIDEIFPDINDDGVLDFEEFLVLLALCLDVKNSNPKDGLTAVEMRPYLERVLLHHANWTIYSTAPQRTQ